MSDQNYSNRSVTQKLGINNGDQLTILNPPEGYLNLIADSKISISHNLQPKTKFIHYFANSISELEKDFPLLKNHLALDGMLWIYNKKGQKDFNQNNVQKIGLANGLVDVKIASINQEWSAMKFVFRVKDRS